jgi:hypothetical protein
LRRIAVLSIVSPLTVPGATFLIRDVRIFDGENVVQHRSLLVEDGKVVKIGGPGLEAAGATITSMAAHCYPAFPMPTCRIQ